MSNFKHGNARKSKITPEYRAWYHMRERCYNPNNKRFNDYGGRGIAVCQRWLESFENFLADMGLRPSKEHSLDRFPNNDGNYEPSNCRWATAKQQANNKTNNINITYNGETKTLCQWAEIFKLNKETLKGRLFKHNWPIEKALNIPTRKLINYSGQSKTLTEWAIESGIPFNTLAVRIKNGWDMKDALTLPIDKSRTPYSRRTLTEFINYTFGHMN